MKNINTLIPILIAVLVILGVIIWAVIFYNSDTISDKSNLVKGQVIDLKRTTTPAKLTLQDPITPTNVPSELSTLEGTFIYPSEGIPQNIQACAENIVTEEITCSPTLFESGLNNTFSFYVPPGRYYIFAQNGTDGPTAYYTEFVTCGLLATCTSHKKIAIHAKSGETVKDLKPHDWYNN